MSLEELYALARQMWVVWLMIMFLGIIWWALRPKNKQRFEDAGNIPFKDDKD